jgi:uncharacterized protein (TIGR02996 family)
MMVKVERMLEQGQTVTTADIEESLLANTIAINYEIGQSRSRAGTGYGSYSERKIARYSERGRQLVNLRALVEAGVTPLLGPICTKLAATWGEPGPRLVLADWLDDRGLPGGDWLRLDVQMAQLQRKRRSTRPHAAKWETLPRVPFVLPLYRAPHKARS